MLKKILHKIGGPLNSSGGGGGQGLSRRCQEWKLYFTCSLKDIFSIRAPSRTSFQSLSGFQIARRFWNSFSSLISKATKSINNAPPPPQRVSPHKNFFVPTDHLDIRTFLMQHVCSDLLISVYSGLTYSNPLNWSMLANLMSAPFDLVQNKFRMHSLFAQICLDPKS